MAAGLLMPLLMVELVLRIAGPALPGIYQTATFNVPAIENGRKNNPDTSGWRRAPEYVSWVRINSKGLRGPDLEYSKPPGTFRILMLGDSFTFGGQVFEEQTLVTRLQERLNASAEHPRFETINAGTDGWSTANEYVWLTSEGHRYEPDLVLLMFFVGNDPDENADPVQTFRRRTKAFGLSLDQGSPIDPLRQALRRGSLLYNAFETGVLLKMDAPVDDVDLPEHLLVDFADPRIRRLSGADRQSPGWAASQLWLLRLRDFCAEKGIKLAVVGIPTREQLAKAGQGTTTLRDISERLRLPFIDLLGPFRAEPASVRERLYFEQNLHWRPDGHDTAARVIASELLERRLVPASGP